MSMNRSRIAPAARAALVGLVLAGLALVAAPRADAGEWSGDFCRNLRGAQTMTGFHHSWTWKRSTPRIDDCRRIVGIYRPTNVMCSVIEQTQIVTVARPPVNVVDETQVRYKTSCLDGAATYTPWITVSSAPHRP